MPCGHDISSSRLALAGQSLFADVVASKGDVEFYQYTGSGHLFSDPSLPDEYDADHAALLTQRVLRFLS